jgi:hypothetical protein
MKLTEQQLKQIIKEELEDIRESKLLDLISGRIGDVGVHRDNPTEEDFDAVKVELAEDDPESEKDLDKIDFKTWQAHAGLQESKQPTKEELIAERLQKLAGLIKG